jgi:hypothetical protein
MPEITFYKNSKYYSQLIELIKLKKEDKPVELDVGNDKKNEYIDVTKIITRILTHAMKQKVNENLEIHDIKEVKNNIIPLEYSSL